MPESQNLPNRFKKFVLLEKWDEFQGLATGIATGEMLDRDNEILDYAKSKPFFESWSESVHKDTGGKSFGNVRLQHDDKKVAGKLTSIEFNDDDKLIRVVAKIVDPVAKEMLSEGCLSGFSIGGSYVKKTPLSDGTTRYVADPAEISVVDRPALPQAVFQSVKADGSIELKKFARYEKASGDSFNEIRDKLQGALDIKYAAGNGRWIWIRDVYESSLIYTISDRAAGFTPDKMFEASYEIDGEDVTLGDPVEVKQSYVPVKAEKSAKESEPASISHEEHTIIQEHLDEASEALREHVEGDDKCACKDCTEKRKANKAVRYLVTESDGTTHLPVSDEDGTLNHRLMGAAWAALHGGYRGNKYEGPDKQKAITRLKGLYEKEGMDLPETAKAALSETLSLMKRLEASEDIETYNEEITNLLNGLESLLEKTMADTNKDGILSLDKAARHSIHQKLAAMKAAHTRHLEACKAHHDAHKAHHDAMQAHIDGVTKLLGGGPESMHEGGEPEVASPANPAVVPQAAGASDTAGKSYVQVGKDEKGEAIFKLQATDRPLMLSDLSELGKGIVKQVLAVQAAAVDSVIGDRGKVKPFVKAATKAEDGAGAGDGAGELEKMSPEDWEKYRNGDREAIAKAQRCTAAKWQPVPSRIVNREAARQGVARMAG